MQKRIPVIIIIVSLVSFVAMRLFPVWVDTFQPLEQLDSSPIGEYLNETIHLNVYWEAILSTLFVTLISLVAITTLGKIWIPEHNKLGLFLSILFFLSVGYQIQQVSVAYLIPASVLFSFVVLYSNNEKRINQYIVFNLFLLIGFGSIVSGYFLMLIPYYLVSLFVFYKLNLREIIAGLFGVVIPYWLLFGMSYYFTGDFEYFYRFFDVIQIELIDFSTIPPGFAIYIPAITIYTLVAVANDFRSYSSVSTQKRNLFITSNVLVLYSFGLYLMSAFPLYVAVLTSAVPFGLLFSGYLQNNTRVRSSIFFIVLACSILFSFVLEF